MSWPSHSPAVTACFFRAGSSRAGAECGVEEFNYSLLKDNDSGSAGVVVVVVSLDRREEE